MKGLTYIMFKLIQVVLDVLVGIAAYFSLKEFTEINANTCIILAIVICAIFAEVFEVRLKH